MLEIMCRDDTTTAEELEAYADVIRQLCGEDVCVITNDEFRAAVWWSAADVRRILKDYADDFQGVNFSDGWIAELLQTIEPQIHQAMLGAGWDEIYTAIDEIVFAQDDDEPEE